MQMSFRKVGGILLVTEVQSLVAKDESSLATFWLRFPGHTLVGDEHLPSRTQIRGKWLGLRSLPHVQSYVSIVMGFAGNCFPHFSPLFFPSFIRLDAPNQVFYSAGSASYGRAKLAVHRVTSPREKNTLQQKLPLQLLSISPNSVTAEIATASAWWASDNSMVILWSNVCPCARALRYMQNS